MPLAGSQLGFLAASTGSRLQAFLDPSRFLVSGATDPRPCGASGPAPGGPRGGGVRAAALRAPPLSVLKYSSPCRTKSPARGEADTSRAGGGRSPARRSPVPGCSLPSAPWARAPGVLLVAPGPVLGLAGGITSRWRWHGAMRKPHFLQRTPTLSEPQITSEVIAVAISCLLCVRGRAVYTGSCFALPVQTVSFDKGRGKPKNILGV